MILVAGVDEAGRGPIAGEVFAAAVILDQGCEITGIVDSKKLSPSARDRLCKEIKSAALSWAVSFATVAEIDQMNILKASLLAMKRAIEMLDTRPDLVLVDGNHVPSDIDIEVRSIIRGDQTEKAISAASIIAKVARDNRMRELHDQFPQWMFDTHKGYPTKKHIEIINDIGLTPHHRRTFAPVGRVIERQKV
jgi:ribonuclease HII